MPTATPLDDQMYSEQPFVPQWRIVVPAPDEWLNSNDHDGGWQRRKRLTEQWRTTATLAARAAQVPRLQSARIIAQLRFHRGGRRDPGNWYPTAKACVDGIVDAKVLPDDSAKFLVGPDMRLGPSTPTPGGLLVLFIGGREVS
jgi:hypothetical protein